MPRKITKRTSQSAKWHFIAAIQKLEKEFLTLPAQLTTQLTQANQQLKQQQIKIKNAAGSLQTKINQAENKIKSATVANNKKQLQAAKKSHGEQLKIQRDLNNQLKEITRQLELNHKKQVKITALRKNLTQFEKEWAKNKITSTKVKTTEPKSAPKKAVTKTQSPVNEAPRHIENFEPTVNQARADDNIEITS